jgi:hypothetical protein
MPGRIVRDRIKKPPFFSDFLSRSNESVFRDFAHYQNEKGHLILINKVAEASFIVVDWQ